MDKKMFPSTVMKIGRRNFFLGCASSLALAQTATADSQSAMKTANTPPIRIVPIPQFLDHFDGRVPLTNGNILSGNSAKEQLAVALLLDKTQEMAGAKILSYVTAGGEGHGARICLVDWSHDSPLKMEIDSSLSKEDKQVLSDPSNKEQSYVVRVDPKRGSVMVLGGSPLGVLYGSVTLVQILRAESGELFVPALYVRDFPDFRYRAASDWLVAAETNRWAYDWGDGKRAFVKRVKRKLDFCLSYKINMVIFDGFGWHSEKFPGYGAMMRELNRYGRDRGIKLLFGGYGANTQPSVVRPEHNIGTVWENRESYPHGDTYPCFGQEGIPGPYLGTCRANAELNRLKAEEMERFVRTVEPGALYIHHEDRGVGTPKEGDPYEDELWRTWKTRDQRCRNRWPNDDLLAKDGGAGAVAYGYRNYLEAILKVKNPESGYSSDKDCEIVFVSPGYNPIPTDPKDWVNHLEFWTNVLSFFPDRKNFLILFREVFPQQKTGECWVNAYKLRMNPLNLNSRMFFFLLGGGDFYTNNYPFVATAVMNGFFKGGDAVYNFSGGVHQEPLQAFNAEFSWNTQAPGYRIPGTYEEFRDLRRALTDAQETPEPIFGSDGFLPMICQRIYGKQAGAVMSQFMVLLEPQPQIGNQPLAPTLPPKLCPISVLWGVLPRDEPSWQLEISQARTLRVLQNLNITPEEWQGRLSRVWSAYTRVTDNGIKLIREALNCKDLKGGAREDVEYLLRCLHVGKRFADLVASFHATLASLGERVRRTDSLDATRRKSDELGDYLDSNFGFDTVCPLGGDQGYWLESLAKIRNYLQDLVG